MASSRKELSLITDREIEKVNIASLADRPTSGSRYGIGDLTAQDLKERFDAFPKLVKDRLNAIVSALRSDEASKYMTLHGLSDGIDNLYDFVALFCKKQSGKKNISDYIEALYTRISAAEPKSETLQAIIDDMAAFASEIDAVATDNQRRIAVAETNIQNAESRLDAIDDYINNEAVVDSSESYIKLVPENARKNAKVLTIGGMSYKSRNLIPFPYESGGVGSSLVKGGVTFTVQPDGGIYVKGTADSTTYFFLNRRITFASSSVNVLGSSKTFEGKTFSDVYYYKAADGTVVTSITVYAGETYDRVFYPMINDGTTALPFEAFEGLRDTKTVNIKSQNSNMVVYPYYETTKTENGITFLDNGDGSITANGTATKEAAFWFFYQWGKTYIPAGNYFLSGCPEGGDSSSFRINFALRNYEGKIIFDKSDKGSGLNISLDVPAYALFFRIVIQAGTTVNNLVFKPMLNYGESALEFVLGKTIDTIPIPEAVQSLDGYGLGISNDLYNYVDLVKKKYHPLVGEVDLGTLDWTYENPSFSAMLSDIKPTASGDYQARKTGFLCAKYNPSSNVNYAAMDDKSILRREIKKIHIRDSAYTDAAAFKAAMSGVMLVYELADPKEIDITNLFPADNEIEVEQNGYLEFVNEHKNAVPNSVQFNVFSSHQIAFEHAYIKGNPHGTTAADVGAYSKEESDDRFIHTENGKVPSDLLPSYVDDVLEYDTKDDFPETGESGKIYVDKSTNKSHRWSGTGYVELTSSALILGETSETAYRGDRGKIAYDHSQTAGNPHGTKLSDIVAVTAADNGKFLQVVDGDWKTVTIATAEGGSF